MKHSRARLAAAAAVLAVSALAVPAALARTARAADGPAFFGRGADHAVFVQTDNTAGNQIVAYRRAADGTLTAANTYATGGLGGVLAGSVVDHLASQGSLVYDQRHALLYAVNAGSNTVSVFSVAGDRLNLTQVLDSGGTFPVSVAVHGDVVYVLNAENGGNVQGYVILLNHLIPIPGSNRPLGLNPAATPQFTNTPGQVAFSPDGSELFVTTKANGNDVDVFGVGPFGRLSANPVVNPEPGTVPFAISFDRAGHLVIAEAGRTRSQRSRSIRTGRSLSSPPSRPVKPRHAGSRPSRGCLRLQRGQLLSQRLPVGRRRPARTARQHHHGCGNGRCFGLVGWTLPLRPDRGSRDRRRVSRQRRRLAHQPGRRDRARRRRRRRNRRLLRPVQAAAPRTRAPQPARSGGNTTRTTARRPGSTCAR